MLNNVDRVYHDLLKDILENGHDKGDRTGTGTRSVYGRQIRFNLKEGFPLISTKKLYTRGIIHELLWFLNGDTNIKYLVDNNVKIWNEWPHAEYVKACEADKVPIKYLKYDPHMTVSDIDDMPRRPYTLDEFVEQIKEDEEFAKEWGNLGPVYGKQWVDWDRTVGPMRTMDNAYLHSSQTYKDQDGNDFNIPSYNQIQNLIDRLNEAPDCRRMIVSAWNVADLPDMALMPCHYGFQVWTRELSAEERLDYYHEADHEQPVKLVNLIVHKNSDNQHIHDWLDDWAPFVPKREISLMWNQRSVDTFLGLPFNIASYGFLLEMIAQQTNMVAGELIGNLGDTHLYSNHFEYAKKQLERDSHVGSKAVLKLNKAKDIFSYKLEDFKIEGYEAHPNWKNVPIAV